MSSLRAPEKPSRRPRAAVHAQLRLIAQCSLSTCQAVEADGPEKFCLDVQKVAQRVTTPAQCVQPAEGVRIVAVPIPPCGVPEGGLMARSTYPAAPDYASRLGAAPAQGTVLPPQAVLWVPAARQKEHPFRTDRGASWAPRLVQGFGHLPWADPGPFPSTILEDQ